MKKIIIFVPIIFLIFATTITKNSTKKLDKNIFKIKENLRLLEYKYELVLLDYNYLTSPKKLMEYQQLYFDNQLVEKNIKKLKLIEIENSNIFINNIYEMND
tara:strand:+ start:150 stop:455 length:306 start_codon:yes stop_codon:yes gene_type:complete